jgi:hypothetical protein
VSVPIDWPATIEHAGNADHATGKEGDRVADRT